jgi:hypothetical protein
MKGWDYGLGFHEQMIAEKTSSLFYFVTYEWAQQARVFVTGNRFQPSVF